MRAVEVYSRACPLFVPLVEEGWTDNDVVEMTVKAYLGSLKQSGIDTLILGCTHYPLLKKAIRKFMGSWRSVGGLRRGDSERSRDQRSKRRVLTRKTAKEFIVFSSPMLRIASSRLADASLVRKWNRRCASNAKRFQCLALILYCNRR